MKIPQKLTIPTIAAPALLITAVLFTIGSAHAASVRVTQEWNERNFATNGFHALTNAFYTDDALTGVGVELILVDRFSVLRLLNNIGQNFSVADFTDPPTLAAEGNMVARYNNGIFQYLSHVDIGGSARILLREGTVLGPVSGSLNIAGSELIYHFPVSGRHNYELQTTAFTITNVPLPGVLPVFALALFSLRSKRRSTLSTVRNRHATPRR